MSELFSELGVEPIALLWQTANFAVVIAVLWRFVYTPLTALVLERTKKIEQGLEDATRAGEELARAESDYAARLREAERTGTDIVKKSSTEAESRAREIIASGEARGEAIVAEARAGAERARADEFKALEKEAKRFVESVLLKTVSLDPSKVDGALVEQAIAAIQAEKRST